MTRGYSSPRGPSQSSSGMTSMRAMRQRFTRQGEAVSDPLAVAESSTLLRIHAGRKGASKSSSSTKATAVCLQRSICAGAINSCSAARKGN